MPQGQVPVEEEPPRQSRFLSIRTKLTVSFSLMSVAILLLIQWVDLLGVPLTAYPGRLGQQRAEAFRNLELLADRTKEQLLRWIEQLRADIRVIARNRFTTAAVIRLRVTLRELFAENRENFGLWDLVRTDQDYRLILQHLNDIKQEYGIYNRLMLIDAETGTVFVSTDEALQGADFSQQDFFSQVLRSNDAYIGNIRISARDRQAVLYLSHAIRDEAGVVAVLCMEVNTDHIIRPMLHTGKGLGETGEVLLINQEVRSFLSLKHPLADGTIPKPLDYQIHAEPAVRAARGEEGTIEALDYRGEPVLAAYRYILVTTEWGWGMVVKRDREELFAPLRRAIIHTSIVGLTGILALVGLTIWLASRLSHPILALSQTAVRVTQGDLEARAPVLTADEVGYLARTFNTMLQRIKERTEELTILNKELEAFSYSVSHDLRAPLLTIEGFSRALLEDYAEKLDPEFNRLLHIIQSNVQHMGQLIEDLLAFSRFGRQEMHFTVIEMTELARAVADELASSVPERHLQVEMQPLPPALGDRGMMRQVWVNLLANAIKFTRGKDPAVIEVGHLVRDNWNVYYVKDNGVGFDMQYSNKLFGVFQRLHAADEFEGTGVGLAIVQQIIQRHGGRVWAEGRVHEGATIYFRLPREKK